MSPIPNSFGVYIGNILRVIKGDARSLEYSSHTDGPDVQNNGYMGLLFSECGRFRQVLACRTRVKRLRPNQIPRKVVMRRGPHIRLVFRLVFLIISL